MANIFVIDTDTSTLSLVRRTLSSEAHTVQAYTSSELAFVHAVQRPPDLIILNTILPGVDGLTLCRKLRATSVTAGLPILFLTGHNSARALAEALDCGGDDCLRKPFAPQELAARVRALLRRARLAHNGLRQPNKASAAYIPPGAALRLLPEQCAVQVGARVVKLTPLELNLLRYLLQRPGSLHPPERLLQDVWGYPGGAGSPALVRTHIRNLRRKIEPDPKHPTILLSKHGRGYMLNVAPGE